ncbi:Clp1/GlmU family protein [Thermococcus sp. Bubb.Bath]|uniref:Clp1/GlmU family protein n=1 Tax=Thermococcus sp. Bubb.Bath TaxID=1638242 RepID=UPI00143BED2B|nr:Clp1/GlmU family protein [Thermococcus sp. Bubb.Bath]NJF24710.1 polyhydroxyalkanoate depolymerase [Thermococcus sp. Bubb.Bath]
MEAFINKAAYTREVPEDRTELVDALASAGKGTVMFVGDVDSGKTTTVTFVANELVGRGYRVAIVDSDVGQKSILPPATVSLGFLESQVEHLSQVKPFAHYFVGITTPSEYMGETVIGVKRLVEIGRRNADFVLIDTTGFIRGRGFELKRLKVEAVLPDLVVFIEKGNEMEKLKHAVSGLAEVVTLKASPSLRPHSPGERREIRRAKWRSYFKGSRLVEVDVSGIPVTGTIMFSGRPLTLEERELLEKLQEWVVFAGWKVKGEYVVAKADLGKGRTCRGNGVHAVDFESLSNLLVGFIDENGLCLGLGILKWPRFSDGVFEVLTPIDEETLALASELRLGRLRVTEDGEELSLLQRDDL